MHWRAQHGRTPLIWAAEKGHTDCARLLLDAGADTNAKGDVRARASFFCAPRRISANERV
jgi:ankyrin repeat protein